MRTDILQQAQAIRASMDAAAIVLTDEQASKAPRLYQTWAAGLAVKAGDRLYYTGTDRLYKVISDHTAQADWNPVDAPSLWAEVLAGQDGTAIGEWVQPDSTNPYMRGDKVNYKGKLYESEVDNNVWEPGVYGWVEI